MRWAKTIVGAAVVLASFGGPAAQAAQAPDRGCTAVAVASPTCSYVARSPAAVLAVGRFDVTVERGERVISDSGRALAPKRLPLEILPGDRVTVRAWYMGIATCFVGIPSFVRVGPEIRVNTP